VGIIFIDSGKYTYKVTDKLKYRINQDFNWDTNVAYETRDKTANTLFISNRNHVKGLEFPFVICISQKILNTRSYRNAAYTLLTRSFIKSYFLVNKRDNEETLRSLESGLHIINERKEINIIEPTELEKEKIRTTISTDQSENISFYDFVNEIFEELNIIHIYRTRLFELVNTTFPDNFNKSGIKDFIEMTHNIWNSEDQ
jgi:superfamily I DNA and RNA helicase